MTVVADVYVDVSAPGTVQIYPSARHVGGPTPQPPGSVGGDHPQPLYWGREWDPQRDDQRHRDELALVLLGAL